MTKPTMPLPLLSLGLLLLSVAISGGTVKLANGQKTWCVAKPSADETTLANNLYFACSMMDCSPIGKHGPCFFPDRLVSHASFAMNLYYQSMGRNSWNCHFNGTGLVVVTDPSYGKCKYV